MLREHQVCLGEPIHDWPTPLMVADDVFPPELVAAADAEWPDATWPHWHRYDSGKLATKDTLRIPPACNELLRRMLCLPVREWFQMRDAFGDWHCHGAGMHSVPPGSRLGVHLDSDHHPLFCWRRAVNAVLFVNQPKEGGKLQFYDPLGEHVVAEIEPQFNRLVLFVPSDTSFHGVSRVHGKVHRKTLTAFYWRPGDGDRKRTRATFVTE